MSIDLSAVKRKERKLEGSRKIGNEFLMKCIKEYCAGAKGRQRVSKEKNMSYYNVCEHCGSNLDPGEKCDCMEQQEGKETRKMKEKVFCEREKEVLVDLKGAFVTNVETTDEGVVISALKTYRGRLCRDEYFIACDSVSERME